MSDRCRTGSMPSVITTNDEARCRTKNRQPGLILLLQINTEERIIARKRVVLSGRDLALHDQLTAGGAWGNFCMIRSIVAGRAVLSGAMALSQPWYHSTGSSSMCFPWQFNCLPTSIPLSSLWGCPYLHIYPYPILHAPPSVSLAFLFKKTPSRQLKAAVSYLEFIIHDSGSGDSGCFDIIMCHHAVQHYSDSSSCGTALQ